MKVVYIAGPFRGPTAWDIECNVRKAETIGLQVASMGAMPLIPHTNTRFFHGQLTADFWIEGTLELLRRADAVMVLPDWERSEGTRGEVREAQDLGKPVFETLVDLRRYLEGR